MWHFKEKNAMTDMSTCLVMSCLSYMGIRPIMKNDYFFYVESIYIMCFLQVVCEIFEVFKKKHYIK